MTQLGGASVIRMEEIKGTGGKMAFEIGATSVGGSLTSQRDGGKCFMGPHLTLTDLAVTLAKTQIGGADAARASKSFRSRQDAEACYEIVRRSLEKEVNLLKQDATELPLILVGGGNLLFAGDTKFAGVSKVLKPEHSEVASAIGAVAAKVGASIPYTLVSARDFPPTKTNTSAEIIETSFKRQLVQKCASQGAVADSVVVTDFEVVPALHMDGEFYAVRGRAQGKVDVARVNSALGSDAELIELLQTVPPLERNLDDEGTYRHEHERTKFLTESYLPAAPSALAALPPPNVRGGVWTLSPVDVECIAVGAAVLGAGTNSGQPRVALWRVLNAIVEGRRELRVISPKLLDKSRHVVFPVAFAGSAAIGGELIGSGAEFGAALANSQQLCDKQIAGKDTVLLAACMAGASGLEALAAAAQTGLPILDADAMGRSLPQLRHAMSFHLAGSALSPISICGAARNGTEFRPSAVKETSFEKIEQQVQTQLVQKHGGVAALCLPPLNADQVKDTGLCFGSISLAYNVGRAIVSARAAKQDPVRAAVAALGGKVLFAGSVAAVTPATGKRFAAGYITVKSENAANALQEAAVRVYHISENITVQNAANNQYLATVPDAIAVLDADTGAGLSVDEYAFGQRVVVVVIPSHAAFRSGSLLHESSPRRLDKDLVVEPVLAQPPRGNVISLCD